MSKIIGTVFPNGKEPMQINQFQHAQPNGKYKIQDVEKRAEYDRLTKKTKEQKQNENQSR